MLETVIAVLVISFAFMALFTLSQLLTRKILLEHAAMRVARARTVGLNDFMCVKSARVATMPIAGRRLWPTHEEEFDWAMELRRVPDYMFSDSEGRARAILDYEGWHHLRVRPGDGTHSVVKYDNLEGRAGIEQNATYYLFDQGL